MPQEMNPIVSEEYADLIIEVGSINTILKIFPTAIVTPLNYLISLVNIPVSLITENSISEIGYGAFPAFFGLVSKASLEASNITKLQNFPTFNLHGQGVLIGILDTGIDFTNPIFRYEDGTTRIVSIWDQTIQSDTVPEGFPYGTVYTRDQINQALQSETPFEIVPSKDEIGHGTMLAGIAGGNDVPENNFYGIATEAEFIVVKMKTAKEYLKKFYFFLEDAIVYQENDLSFALEYLVRTSTKLSRPLALCISVNTSEGPHEGRGTLGSYLSLIASTPGIACIIPVGNEGNARRHYFGLPHNITRTDTVELYVGESAHSFTMQLWGTKPSIYSVDIVSPSGEYIPNIVSRTDEFRKLSFIFENTIIYLDYQLMESQSADPFILFRIQNPSPGIWKFVIHESGDTINGFHIWLPMGGLISDNIYFIEADPYTTILSLSANPLSIAVTAYNYVDESIYINAGKGFTRSGGIAPLIAAPGVNVIGPTLEGTFVEYSGTSVAGAHLTGVAAMLLEWGIVKGNLPGMSSVEMNIFLARGARRKPNLEYPNRDWGYGILDIYSVFDSLRIKA